MKKLLLIVSAIWFLTFIPGRTYASASDVSPFIWGMSMGPTAISTTFAVGNFVYVGKGYRAPAAWRIGGYITGSLNIIGGLIGLWAFPAISVASDKPGGKGASYALAGTMIGVGVITIASAITSSLMPERYGERHRTRIGVSPMLFRDSSNAIAGGVGLSVMGW
jgi:hypothetical protein